MAIHWEVLTPKKYEKYIYKKKTWFKNIWMLLCNKAGLKSQQIMPKYTLMKGEEKAGCRMWVGVRLFEPVSKMVRELKNRNLTFVLKYLSLQCSFCTMSRCLQQISEFLFEKKWKKKVWDSFCQV